MAVSRRFARRRLPFRFPELLATCLRPPLSQRDLDELSERLEAAPIIGFDTEFVSEDTFHPELCLIQVVTPDEMAVIDPQEVDVLPFWRAVAAREKTTVFHAGREELSFMLRAVGAIPQRSFDVQYAAGFCSNEFPASYGSVVGKFLGKQPMKGEQRTDWRRRPLTDAQINYALEDVRYLLPLFDRLTEMLNKSRSADVAQGRARPMAAEHRRLARPQRLAPRLGDRHAERPQPRRRPRALALAAGRSAAAEPTPEATPARRLAR